MYDVHLYECMYIYFYEFNTPSITAVQTNQILFKNN
jgi:hypothetical protein